MESFSYYNNCLFCPNDISNENERFKEHIIPQNIFGFWKSRDVCKDCGEFFGEKIDNFALKHPLIIEAIKTLNLTDKHVDDSQLNYYGIDSASSKNITMFKKKGKFYIKTINDIVDEQALIWNLRKLAGNLSDIDDELLDKEMEKIVTNQQCAKAGDITKSEIFNLSFKKGIVQGVHIGESENISRLITKIVVFALFYFIQPKQLYKIEHLEELIDYTCHRIDKPSFLIKETRASRKKFYKPYHRIWIHSSNDYLTININLFFYLRWFIFLPCKGNIIMKDEASNILKSLGVRFLFSKLNSPYIDVLEEPKN